VVFPILSSLLPCSRPRIHCFSPYPRVFSAMTTVVLRGQHVFLSPFTRPTVVMVLLFPVSQLLSPRFHHPGVHLSPSFVLLVACDERRSAFAPRYSPPPMHLGQTLLAVFAASTYTTRLSFSYLVFLFRHLTLTPFSSLVFSFPLICFYSSSSRVQ